MSNIIGFLFGFWPRLLTYMYDAFHCFYGTSGAASDCY